MSGPRVDGRSRIDLRPSGIVQGVAPFAESFIPYQAGGFSRPRHRTGGRRRPEWPMDFGLGRPGSESRPNSASCHASSQPYLRAATSADEVGRTIEIQRLAGCCMRRVRDLYAAGEHPITAGRNVVGTDRGTR